LVAIELVIFLSMPTQYAKNNVIIDHLIKKETEMQVQKYLRMQYDLLGSVNLALDELTKDYAIKVRQYDEGLVVLNYNQIDSPKSHPIVMECRGLILDNNFNVVSRSFDRFFNLGEAPETQTHLDWSKATCAEKIDGSLIRIYFWNNKWHIASRGMAFAEGAPNGFDISFRGLVLKALDVDDVGFQTLCGDYLCPEITYICEITAVENRCVKAYTGYTLHYLSARNNQTFEFYDDSAIAREVGMSIPKQFSFSSEEDCKRMVDQLKNLDEGYVVYQSGIPVAKIKSPAYCAVHLLRGEGLNPKRVSELVLTNEQEEYLVYFPEDRGFIQPYVDKLTEILTDLYEAYANYSVIESQKDFAISIKNVKGNSVLFTARKMKCTVGDAWKAQTDAFRLRVLMEAMLEKETV